jgi:hypothetical protein
VVDLSSSLDEEDVIPDTSRDFEFAQRLYGELNRALLGSSDDDNIIILSESNDEKEEVREKSTGTKDASASTAVNPTSTASTGDADAPMGAKNNNSDDQGPIRRSLVRTVADMTLVSLRLSIQ